ncbi:MAG: superoxide dismutase family protein [Pseudonocardia sp.]|nr:superoxide dismutase family protein [Pseudonocardia sp.]
MSVSRALGAAAVLASFALAGCTAPSVSPSTMTGTVPPPTTVPAATSAAPAPTDVRVSFAEEGPALTYDVALVPVGAGVHVTTTSAAGRSTVTLELTGLVPNRQYGAHAHAKTCGPAPADSGPHVQHEKDPVSPSVDPAFANPRNEVWLDVTTDAQGDATATSTVDWEFTGDARPNAVVVHAKPTSTEPGKAGTAGDRVACVSLPTT